MFNKNRFTCSPILPALLLSLILSCKSNIKSIDDMKAYDTVPGTFGYDLSFLNKYQKTVVLSDSQGKAQLVIVPGWQARVMTSSAGGPGGFSFGWINYKLIASGETLEHINPYGGEERIWLGPEGGKFSVYHKKGLPQIFENWTVPPELDTKGFDLIEASQTKASFTTRFILTNYTGNLLEVGIERTIQLLDSRDISRSIGMSIPEPVSAVAYQSENVIINRGNSSWTRESGMLSLWLLSMLNPSPGVTIFIPFRKGNETELGQTVVDDYFGKVPADRLIVDEGMIYFKADGKSRGKIGISPRRAMPFSGSYDELNGVLTLLWCELPDGKTDYVNSKWGVQDDPFSGDAINAYNDGPVEDGTQMGPFFELESSSPAANLKPGEKMLHRQRIFHFEGSEEQLSLIAEKVFGVTLDVVKEKFRPQPE